MKWYKRLKIYKRPNCTFNPEKIEAVSYNWRTFVTMIEGKVIFNGYNYSQTTRNHQYTVKDLLKKHNIKIDFISNSDKSLTDSYMFNSEILDLCFESNQLIDKINTKGTRKVKNLERRYTLISNIKRIDEILSFNKIIGNEYYIPDETIRRIDEIKAYIDSKILYEVLQIG